MHDLFCRAYPVQGFVVSHVLALSFPNILHLWTVNAARLDAY